MSDIENLIKVITPGLSLMDGLTFFFLIFTRFLVMTMIMPIFGAELLQSMVRVALATLLSIVAFFMFIDQAPAIADLDIFFIALLFIKEVLLGFLLGFTSSLIFFAYELFGELIDLARAASMSKLLVPELKHQSSPMGSIFFQLALVLFFQAGFYRDIVLAVYQSFHRFPVRVLESRFLSAEFFTQGLNIMGALFEIAVRFSLPIITACFLIDFAFGLLNRVAPQINAYFLSLPAKMVGGLLMLFFLIPFLLDDFSNHYHELARFLQGIMLIQ